MRTVDDTDAIGRFGDYTVFLVLTALHAVDSVCGLDHVHKMTEPGTGRTDRGANV